MRDYRLIKRSGSPRWYITWTEGRRSRRVPTGTEDHEQALKILHLFALEQDKPKDAKPEDLPIVTALRWYYDERASKLPSAEQARIAIDRFGTFYGIASISVIEKSGHERYLRERLEAGARWQTINRERMVLRAALNHARKHHGLLAAPHVPTIRPDDPEAEAVEPKGRPLTIPELASLYAAAKSEHMRLFILTLMGTLCRPDAARDLRIKGQMDTRHRLIKLNPDGRKQTKKYRPVVPMPSFLREAIKDAKREYLLEYHGERIDSTKTAWRLLRKAAGLGPDVNPYSIRHTMARELRRRRVPAEQVSIMLGHRPTDTSRTDLVYAPYEPGYCKGALRAIERVYGRMMQEVARQARANVGIDEKATLPETGPRKAGRMAASKMVGTTGIEPVTPTMSRKGRNAK